MRRKVDPEEVIQHRIKTGETYGKIAEHFGISYPTVMIYVREAKKANPQLITQLENENNRKKKAKINPEEVVRYMIDNGASIHEATIHFKICEETVSHYIKKVKETNPKLIERLTISRERKREEVIRYIIETGATVKETANHFGVCEGTIYSYISRVKRANPKLIEELKEIRKQRTHEQAIVKKARTEEIVQYIIETRATVKEVANHFGIPVSAIYEYRRKAKGTGAQLKKATAEEVVQYIINEGATVKEAADHFRISVTAVRNYINKVKEANSEAREQLEQLEQARTRKKKKNREQQPGEKKREKTANQGVQVGQLAKRTRAQTAKQVAHEQQQERITQQPNESAFDVLLRVFNNGRMTAHDTEVLLQFQQRLEKIQQVQSQNYRWENALSYSTMISALTLILSTNTSKYQNKRLPMLRSYITAKCEKGVDITIGKLAGIIEKNIRKKVYPEELMLIINRLISEGKGNEVSGKIDTKAIANMRSRLELCYEQIRQEGLLLTGDVR